MYMHRNIYRTQSKIYEGAFLRKWSLIIFAKKGFIVDVRLGSKYASDVPSPPVLSQSVTGAGNL